MDIKARIAALLKMTPANGCSEAEALAAAKKAAALMLEYGLRREDIHISEANVRSGTKGRGARDILWPYIADCTNTAVIIIAGVGRGARSELQFIGRAAGPEIATYLVVVCNRAIDNAIREFKAGRFYRARRSDHTRRQAVVDFTTGMALRLGQRLTEMFRPTMSNVAREEANTGVARRYNGSVETRVGRDMSRDHRGVMAGMSAADAVQLAHGVHGRTSGPAALEGW